MTCPGEGMERQLSETGSVQYLLVPNYRIVEGLSLCSWDVQRGCNSPEGEVVKLILSQKSAAFVDVKGSMDGSRNVFLMWKSLPLPEPAGGPHLQPVKNPL